MEQLPEEIVSTPTTNTFKSRLGKYWSIQSLMYEDHKTTITRSGENYPHAKITTCTV